MVFDLQSGQMIWVDSSSGSKSLHAQSGSDGSIGKIVHDEIVRERLTYGELAELWADAYDSGSGVEVVAHWLLCRER